MEHYITGLDMNAILQDYVLTNSTLAFGADSVEVAALSTNWAEMLELFDKLRGSNGAAMSDETPAYRKAAMATINNAVAYLERDNLSASRHSVIEALIFIRWKITNA